VPFHTDVRSAPCTEHMFFDAARIIAVREMIIASDVDGRRAALTKLLPTQREDFIELFRIMDGRPITIRLLDPPLHEFLPHTEKDVAEVAGALGTIPAHGLADQGPNGLPRATILPESTHRGTQASPFYGSRLALRLAGMTIWFNGTG